MLSINTLLSSQQHTLAGPTEWLEGTTLRNIPARISLLPSKPDTGRSVYVSVKNKPLFSFRVTPQGSQLGRIWTDTRDPVTGHGIGVSEHPAAAVALAGLDNVILHVDYPTRRAASLWYDGARTSSVPLLTGTAEPYIRAIAKAGLAPQVARRQWLTVKETVTVIFDDATYTLAPRHTPGWSLETRLVPEAGAWLKNQRREKTIDLNTADALTQLEAIINARPTNDSWVSWLVFRTLTFGTGKRADFAVIHSPFTGEPIHGQPAYGWEEAIDHKRLDFCGDFHWFFGNLQLDITAINPSHATNNKLRHWLVKNPVLIPTT